ncbi:ADP-ribosylglycohydrolase family protein [Actinomadura sp. NPDC047616]|uniref:ADP-ribosylglycohydrolase family protein n=1 Tax=Actinomadura sp. NPDC047616 TaxID=3155914 RepID=UPI0033C216E5
MAPDPREIRMLRPSYPDPDRVLGCLLGGAIGDALGAPVEGVPLAEIRRRYGPDGITGYVPGRLPAGSITDDTQLTMFTVQALVQASVRARARGIGGATPGLLQSAYLTWLGGQGVRMPPQHSAFGPLTMDPAMTSRRAPGRTVLSALLKAAERQRPGWPLGTVDEPINDSKGCMGVVRAAPCGIAAGSAERAFELGRQAAALTHGHPDGQLPAGVLAATVHGLLSGAGLRESLDAARALLREQRRHRETSRALDRAVEMAAEPPTPERLETLGGGWTGEEALAIGVYAALAAEREGAPEAVGRRGLLLAVNHSGDSDSTGAVCGNLLGARYGTAAFPPAWRDGLEVRGTVAAMADDCVQEFGPNPPTGDYGEPPLSWLMRYPEA